MSFQRLYKKIGSIISPINKRIPPVSPFPNHLAMLVIIKDVLTQQDLVSKQCISSKKQVYIIQDDSRSGSRIPDPEIRGVELSKVDRLVLVPKRQPLNGVDPSCWILK
jgi:hypothetical protein